MKVFKNFKGKKILVTGHTGFKGTWLSIWLKQLGATVYGVSLDIPSKPSHFIETNLSSYIEDYRLDIRDGESLAELVQKIQPDFVFHLAAQALVRLSYKNPLETITSNALGSVNLLESLRSLDKEVVGIMITSDKAYDNVEWVWGYRETDRLGGKDPYSASKGMAELAIRSYVDSFFSSPDSNVRIGITRAGNVIGGGDWAIDRIVPDCMQAWANGQTIDIRSPHATRPWQHVLEPLSGYLCLAENLYLGNQNHGDNAEIGHNQEELGFFSWSDLNPIAAFVYAFGDLNCHQKSERSWEINGNQLAVCARDVGLFLGLAIGALLWRKKGLNRWTIRDSFLSIFKDEHIEFLYKKDRRMLGMILVISLGAIPIGVDGFTQLLSPYESTNIVRLITGIGAGFVLSWWSCAAISSNPKSFETAELVKLPANAKLVFKD